MIVFFLLRSMTNLTYAQSENDSTQKVYEFFEISVLPEFPGGAMEMQKFISSHMKYPKEAVDNAIEGTVAIQFVIDKDGSVTNIKILKNPGGGLGEEAERVIGKMPKWSPGYQRNQAVRVKMIVPLKFKMNNDPIPPKNE